MSDPKPTDDASQNEPSAPEYFLYHEPQAAALCGVHALNTLLQGPFIDEFQCAEIAQQLDAQERALMAEAGMESAEFLKFVAEGSANVDNSGMFSVQVLSKALEMWGIDLIPLSSPDAGNARTEPQRYQAFICNLQEHWFTIRKIHDEWWNLNSLFSYPEPLSPFYLAAFLGTLQEQGYTIFLVRGRLLEPDPPSGTRAAGSGGGGNGGAAGGGNYSGSGRWISASEAREAVKEKQAMKQQGFLKVAATNLASMASAAGQRMVLRPRGAVSNNGDGGGATGRGGGQGPLSRAIPNLINDEDEDMFIGDDNHDAELQRVLAASRQDMLDSQDGQGGGDGSMEGVEDADLAAAIAASLADNNGQQQQQEDPGDLISRDQEIIKEKEEPTDTEEAATGVVGVAGAGAPSTSLPELGEEPTAGTADAIEIGVKLPTGERKSRRFIATTDTVGHVAAFAASLGVNMKIHRVALSFPRRVLEKLEISLVEAKLNDKDLVFIEPVPKQ
jgi:Ataxin-3